MPEAEIREKTRFSVSMTALIAIMSTGLGIVATLLTTAYKRGSDDTRIIVRIELLENFKSNDAATKTYVDGKVSAAVLDAVAKTIGELRKVDYRCYEFPIKGRGWIQCQQERP